MSAADARDSANGGFVAILSSVDCEYANVELCCGDTMLQKYGLLSLTMDQIESGPVCSTNCRSGGKHSSAMALTHISIKTRKLHFKGPEAMTIMLHNADSSACRQAFLPCF